MAWMQLERAELRRIYTLKLLAWVLEGWRGQKEGQIWEEDDEV